MLFSNMKKQVSLNLDFLYVIWIIKKCIVVKYFLTYGTSSVQIPFLVLLTTLGPPWSWAPFTQTKNTAKVMQTNNTNLFCNIFGFYKLTLANIWWDINLSNEENKRKLYISMILYYLYRKPTSLLFVLHSQRLELVNW